MVVVCLWRGCGGGGVSVARVWWCVAVVVAACGWVPCAGMVK